MKDRPFGAFIRDSFNPIVRPMPKRCDENKRTNRQTSSLNQRKFIMSRFTTYTKDNAPQESAELVKRSIKAYGFLPNLHAVMAEAPATYKAYLDTFDYFAKETTLSPLEQQVVMQTSNYENNCHYCMPGHSMLMKMMGMPADVIEALREGTPIADAKLDALRSYTRALIDQRGHVTQSQLDAIFAAGYTKRQALEVLTGLAAKLLSNFTNAIAKTEIDAPVKPFAWVHPKMRDAANDGGTAWLKAVA
jgi:alkylhydroperoxidase family enzyme